LITEVVGGDSKPFCRKTKNTGVIKNANESVVLDFNLTVARIWIDRFVQLWLDVAVWYGFGSVSCSVTGWLACVRCTDTGLNQKGYNI
jgi:hypothetical protein